MITPLTTTAPVAPGAQPLVGHALHLMFRPRQFLTSLPACGAVVCIRLGSVPAYVACSPQATHRLLIDDRTFDKGGLFFDRARELFGDGLATCRHDTHRRQRRLVQPAFGKDRLARYTDIMADQATAEIHSWRDGEIIDVGARMHTITAGVTARALFSSDLGGTSAEEIDELLRIYLAGMFWRHLEPTGLAERLPTPANRRYRRATRRLHAVVDEIIDAYRADGVDHGDLLSMLLSARDQDGQALSTTEIHQQVLVFLASGTETRPQLWPGPCMSCQPGQS